jgi:hypothetical protein
MGSFSIRILRFGVSVLGGDPIRSEMQELNTSYVNKEEMRSDFTPRIALCQTQYHEMPGTTLSKNVA